MPRALGARRFQANWRSFSELYPVDNKRILGFPTVKPANTFVSRSRPHQSQVLVDLRSGINSLNNFNQPASLGLQNFMEMAALRLEAVFVISRF